MKLLGEKVRKYTYCPAAPPVQNYYLESLIWIKSEAKSCVVQEGKGKKLSDLKTDTLSSR